MSKIRKLMVVGAMALMMMVVALPPALAQDWCYWGCDPRYWSDWSAPMETATPEETTEETSDWECGWLWDPSEEEWVWACWED